MTGASRIFLGGAVTYSNESKTNVLGVPEDIIVNNGAVSSEVAGLMAEGVRKKFGREAQHRAYGLATQVSLVS